MTEYDYEDDPSWGYDPKEDQKIEVNWWKVATFLLFAVIVTLIIILKIKP